MKTLSASKGIRALIAFVKGGGSSIVSILFSRAKGWTVSKAKAWIKSHDYSVAETKLVYEINVTKTDIEFVEETVPEDYEDEPMETGENPILEWYLNDL
jgi:hypothetical protein